MKREEEDLPYSGRTFVVTGTTTTPRDKLVGRIRELGGKVTVGVSGSTHYLVTGLEPGPAKLKKALAAGTRIISEDEFIEMTEHYVIQPAAVKRVKREETEIQDKIEETEKVAEIKGTGERWIDKYAPQSLSDMVGNPQAIKQVKVHLMSMSLKPILLTGASGIGKTLSVYLIAKELGISLIEYNGTDYRSKQEISILKGLSTQKSLTRDAYLHKNKVILMEEIENMTANDRGGIQEIINMFKKTAVPVILTTNDKTSQNIKGIVSQCKVIQYTKVDSRGIYSILKKIADKEGISVPDSTLTQIGIIASGDVRYAVNIFQYLSKKTSISTDDIKAMQKHITTASIFDITKEIFQSYISPEQKINLFFEEPMFSLLMVFENYLEGCTLKSAAEASDSLSIAEITSNRMMNNDEKRLFPVSAYYTAVKPKIRLKGRIGFSKYLGFVSGVNAKKKKLRQALNNVLEGRISGGWSIIYELFYIMSILQKTSSESVKRSYVKYLKIDKNILSILIDITGIRIKKDELPLLKTSQL